jgi:hypothetical protein
MKQEQKFARKTLLEEAIFLKIKELSPHMKISDRGGFFVSLKKMKSFHCSSLK